MPSLNEPEDEIETLYTVKPLVIDTDPVMNRMLQTPEKYMDILTNIYIGMTSTNKFKQLQETKLGNFYKNNSMFN